LTRAATPGGGVNSTPGATIATEAVKAVTAVTAFTAPQFRDRLSLMREGDARLISGHVNRAITPATIDIHRYQQCVPRTHECVGATHD
jgi:hypothetical protein